MSFHDKVPAIIYLGGAGCLGAIVGEVFGESVLNTEGWGAAVGTPVFMTVATVAWFLWFRSISKGIPDRDFPLDYIDKRGESE